MTPYEYADLAQSAFGNSLSTYAVILSVVSGYLVTTYLVGAKLTRVQASMLTIMFLLAMAILIWSNSSYVFWGIQFSSLVNPEAAGKSPMSPRPWIPSVISLLEPAYGSYVPALHVGRQASQAINKRPLMADAV